MNQQSTTTVELEWPADPVFRAVGRLVLGGVASRIDLPIDRVEELGLALDTVTRAPAVGDTLRLSVEVAGDALIVTVGSFETDPLTDPSVRRVVATLVDDAEPVATDDGRSVVLSVAVPGMG